jgi:hypothetical protein
MRWNADPDERVQWFGQTTIDARRLAAYLAGGEPPDWSARRLEIVQAQSDAN